MEKISGYSAQEALGQTCTMLRFNLCLKKSCPSGIKECGIYERGAVDAKECALRHKDGHDVPVLKSARLVKNGHDSVIGIVETVTDLTELKKARQQIEEISRKLGEVHRLDNIIGKSRAMRNVFSAIRAASASEATVLIQGESGTGKELVAGAIHYNSDRAGKPLVTVNCSALTESLLESELFGHAKGAFTGAIRDRKGRFEEAEGGAVFLDEIGEISPFIQVKLLRVLQEREIERVGESRRRKIDIRIIAATNKDLYQLVQTGEFRQDLYYRLKVFPIDVRHSDREKRTFRSWQVILLPSRTKKQTNRSRVSPRPPCGSSWITPGLEMSVNWRMPSNMLLYCVMKKRSIFSICRLSCERRSISLNRRRDLVNPTINQASRPSHQREPRITSSRNVTGTRQRLPDGGSEPNSYMEVHEKMEYSAETRTLGE